MTHQLIADDNFLRDTDNFFLLSVPRRLDRSREKKEIPFFPHKNSKPSANLTIHLSGNGACKHFFITSPSP